MRQRIARSARGLGCSTFSGVAGVEAELEDPRTSEKQQVRYRRKDGSKYAGDGIRRQKHARSSRAGPSSIWSLGHDQHARQQAKQLFEKFQMQTITPLDWSVHVQGSEEEAFATHSLFCCPAYEAPEAWQLAADGTWETGLEMSCMMM